MGARKQEVFEDIGNDQPLSMRRDWKRAIAAARRLVRDKGGSSHVIDIVQALAGPANAWGFHRMIEGLLGGRLAFEREEVITILEDDAWLSACSSNSVAAEYKRFTAAQNLSAQGLVVETRRSGGDFIESKHPYAWYARRIRDSHDLWHVLTGYGRDGLGEACHGVFTYTQTRSVGWALISVAAYLRAGDTLSRNASPKLARRSLREAWAIGRATAWVPRFDIRTLLSMELAEARRLLGLTTPNAYLNIPPEIRNREAGTNGRELATLN